MYYRFQNSDNDKKERSSISCLTYNEEDDILYCGDERGCIVAYNFKNITNQILVKQDKGRSGTKYDSVGNEASIEVNFSSGIVKKSSSISDEPPVIWRNKEHLESIRDMKYEE